MATVEIWLITRWVVERYKKRKDTSISIYYQKIRRNFGSIQGQHTSNKPSTIRNRKLQRRRSRPFIMARRVIRHPHQDTGYTGVLARSHEEGHSILDMGALDVGDDGVADDCDGEGEEHYCAAEAEAVGDECYKYCFVLDMCGVGKIKIKTGVEGEGVVYL